MSSRIFIVEDDATVGYMLTEYLRLKSFEVTWFREPSAALRHMEGELPDLCILDVSLPVMDGFELARKIRADFPALPVIFLTARSLKVDVLRGFSMGADDYMIKPVDEEELVARIKAVLSRYSMHDDKVKESILTFKEIRLDLNKQELRVGKKNHHVTAREAQLLRIFLKSPGQLIPTDSILREIWGQNDFFNRRSMDVFISRIRKKLSGEKGAVLENVHGKGFILREE